MNALKAPARTALGAAQQFPIQRVNLLGGEKLNMIPRSATAVVAVPVEALALRSPAFPPLLALSRRSAAAGDRQRARLQNRHQSGSRKPPRTDESFSRGSRDCSPLP
jgi:hypothetical protein